MSHTSGCREQQWGESTVLYFTDARLLNPLLNGSCFLKQDWMLELLLEGARGLIKDSYIGVAFFIAAAPEAIH